MAVGVLALLGLAIVVLPPALADEAGLTPAERVSAENDVRGTLLQALAGVVLALGLYFTARTFQLNRQGQITERYTKAIDQLGEEAKPDVRLGGIYALERIARESERDHGPVMEILTAHVRRRAGFRPGGPRHEEPEIDVQAVLAVLGRREVRGRDEKRLDLSGVDLRRAKFGEGHFEHAILIGAHLEEAHLAHANLRGARLAGANLEGADLEGADLNWTDLAAANLAGSILTRSRLQHAWLKAARLEGAILRSTQLEGANLDRANLAGADLSDANLEGTSLEGGDLQGAVLRGAHLKGAYLEGADLSEADLDQANLERAHLKRADLSRAYLHGANLHGAQVQGANLDGAQLEGAVGLSQPSQVKQ